MSAVKRRRWVKLSEGLSFAALAELILSICCLDKDLAETAALLQELDRRQPSSSDYSAEHDCDSAPDPDDIPF